MVTTRSAASCLLLALPLCGCLGLWPGDWAAWEEVYGDGDGDGWAAWEDCAPAGVLVRDEVLAQTITRRLERLARMGLRQVFAR